MSARDLFTRDTWKTVGEGLRGEARRWWTDHEGDLVELGKAEVQGMLKSLALNDGDTVDAKRHLALAWAREDRESWVAYRNGTTKELQGIAARRARILEALENLGMRAARMLGRIARSALGL